MQDDRADRRPTIVLTVLAALAALGVAACGERPPGEFRPVAAVERPATEYETRRVLLEGPRGLFRGLPDAGSERFTPDGRYMRNGVATVSGKYDVWGNRFCVSMSWEGPLDHCRTLFIGPEGPRLQHPDLPSLAPRGKPTA